MITLLLRHYVRKGDIRRRYRCIHGETWNAPSRQLLKGIDPKGENAKPWGSVEIATLASLMEEYHHLNKRRNMIDTYTCWVVEFWNNEGSATFRGTTDEFESKEDADKAFSHFSEQYDNCELIKVTEIQELVKEIKK